MSKNGNSNSNGNGKIIAKMSGCLSLRNEIWNHYTIHSKISPHRSMAFRIWDWVARVYVTQELTFEELKEVLKQMVLEDASRELDAFFKNPNLIENLTSRGVTCGFMKNRDPLGDWEKDGTNTFKSY